ncbi:hypothetical protein HK099_004036 [Clydaea vesicula]|uniref:Protein kinase domain-containing protein n=1 Tax=Clydaea vesicula TaxID=447962 RepID=A0AAD5U3P3_9FUNG|nr:hypothetical protein HK099_004036 [Clydaea vesicula]KAJ3382697.1 hypothetical protein HDU92_004635 [Lobulomyces angularis]
MLSCSRYDISKSPLAAGTFSEVFKAKNKDTKEEVVIKSVLNDADSIKQAKNEIYLLNKLNHKNIVRLLDTFSHEDEKKILLVLEYTIGGDLFELISSKKLKSIEQKNIFKQLAEAVHYLHSSQIVHRDLKVENVLLSRKDIESHDAEDLVKVCDFGLAQEINEVNPRRGSVEYLAPELLLQKEDPSELDLYKTDTWALGVILFALLTGELPFNGSGNKMFLQIALGKYQLPESVVDEDVKDLLKKLLNTNPRERLSCHQILSHKWLN